MIEVLIERFVGVNDHAPVVLFGGKIAMAKDVWWLALDIKLLNARIPTACRAVCYQLDQSGLRAAN